MARANYLVTHYMGSYIGGIPPGPPGPPAGGFIFEAAITSSIFSSIVDASVADFTA